MRVVITGASGNVGTALLHRLQASRTTHEIAGVCRRPPLSGAPYEGVAWTALDLAASEAVHTLVGVFRGADVVVHLAWGFQPSHDRAYLERVGVEGTRAVVEAAHRAGVPKLVHLSSVGAYSPGPKDRPVDEAWPTGGVSTLPYSRQKVAVERLLDAHERDYPAGPGITRLRPGLVLQRDAGSSLLRYGLPAIVPSGLIRRIPVLPLSRDFAVQCIHAADVASAIELAMAADATGAFNLADEPLVTRDLLADLLRARVVHVPWRLLRMVTAATWHTHLQPFEPGWVDLAFTVPLMDTARAREGLGWRPAVSTHDALRQVMSGMVSGHGTTSAVLRPRTVAGGLRSSVTDGPVGRRRLP
jgi:nucleoside-diphosphate-sugar epimerase